MTSFDVTDVLFSLADCFNSGIHCVGTEQFWFLLQITPQEAKQYKDAVGWEYEALLYKLVNAKATALQVSRGLMRAPTRGRLGKHGHQGAPEAPGAPGGEHGHQRAPGGNTATRGRLGGGARPFDGVVPIWVK